MSESRESLRVMRCREEDNDDVIPLIDNINPQLKELYGPYYISEMIRYPDDCHELIVGEDADDTIAGIVFLNSVIDVDQLYENFELTPYHGLKKRCKEDKTPTEIASSIDQLLKSVFMRKYAEDLDEVSEIREAVDEPGIAERS